MSFVAVAIGGAALVGGVASIAASSNASSAAKQGAQIQADSANRAADLQHQEYLQTRDDYAPFRAAGTAAVGKEADLVGLNGQPAQDNAFAGFRADPGYQYNVDQAVRGVDRSAAARGLLTSGATVKAIQDRASNLADQGYSNYFNRIAGIAGTGQTATAGTASAGATAAGNQGSAIMAAGNATASGYINAANATTGGVNALSSSINSGINNYLSYSRSQVNSDPSPKLYSNAGL